MGLRRKDLPVGDTAKDTAVAQERCVSTCGIQQGGNTLAFSLFM